MTISIRAFIQKMLDKHLMRFGVGFSYERIIFKQKMVLANVDIFHLKTEKNMLSVDSIGISYNSIIHLLVGGKRIGINWNNITLSLKKIANNPITIPYLFSYIRIHKNKIEILASIRNVSVVDIDITAIFSNIKDKPECFVCVDSISLNDFKRIFSANLSSYFIKSIYDDNGITVSAYYIHDQNKHYNSFNALIRNYETLNIQPQDIILSKETLIKCLSQRNHLGINYLDYLKIPTLLKKVIILTEDPTYAFHCGISRVALGMTIRENIKKRQLKVGGSTIDQQLIKNALLSEERTLYRKVEEAILTLLMVNYYHVDKKDILEVYLNMIEFGPNIYGIEDASQYYFSKPCRMISPIEALVLAYIIPRPLPFHKALLEKTDTLRENLYLHLLRFFYSLQIKGIANIQQESLYKLDCIQFSPRFGTLFFIKPKFRDIKKIIIHCTGTKKGDRISREQIKKWHLERGFEDIGYHYIIEQDGNVQIGRPLHLVGAHCYGQNDDSIGIAYVGGLDESGNPCNTLNDLQKESLLQLCEKLKRQFQDLTIHGHNEFSNKQCPCFDVQNWLLKELNNVSSTKIIKR